MLLLISLAKGGGGAGQSTRGAEKTEVLDGELGLEVSFSQSMTLPRKASCSRFIIFLERRSLYLCPQPQDIYCNWSENQY